MHNCIFTGHCTEAVCDKSCPMLVETSYLLERNGISMNSRVFRDSKKEDVSRALKVLNEAEGTMRSFSTDNTVSAAELLTYCAICQNWKGSKLHCTVYNLKYSKYIDELKKSWTTRVEPEELEYMRIWSNTAKVLIVSNIDFVNFKDFEAQTLLNIIQNRQTAGLTTVIVKPKNSLIGDGPFAGHLKSLLSQAVIK